MSLRLRGLFIFAFICVHVNGESKVRKMFIKHSSSDLDSSASGYIYRQDGSGPAHIVYLDTSDALSQGKPIAYTFNGDLGAQSAQSYVLSHSGTAVRPSYLYYGAQKQGAINSEPQLKYDTYQKYRAPYQPTVAYNKPIRYTGPVTYKTHVGHKAPHTTHYTEPAKPIAYKQAPVEESAESAENDNEDSGSHESYSYGNYGYGDDGLSRYTHQNYDSDGDHGDHESHYKKEDGSEFGEEDYSKKGEEEHKGYKNDHEFEKGEKGHYEKDDHESHYHHEGGKKGSEYDEADHYGEHHEGEKKSKGGKYGEKKKHKKGSKTTGYHNVFHKDEYKKDHTFYDDGDHKGTFHKYDQPPLSNGLFGV